MMHTIRIPYRRVSSRLGSWLLWITERLRTFPDFSLGSKFCFRCKAFPFVQGHAVGIIENVARGGPVSGFLLRHSVKNSPANSYPSAPWRTFVTLLFPPPLF